MTLRMTKGLPRECFASDELFHRELAEAFGRHWIAVGSIDQYRRVGNGEDSNGADSFWRIDLGSHSIILLHRADGNYAAFHNVCRHRGTRLVEQPQGELKNGCVTCPYHAWTYGADGSLVGAPNMADVPDFDRTDFGLKPVSVWIWADLIFVNLDEASSTFDDELGPLLERMRNWQVERLQLVHTLGYQVAANWKLIFQNYSECYHCPTVHPDLNQQTPYKSATNDLVEGPILGGPMQLADGFETVSSDGKAVGPLFDTLDAEQKRSIYYYTVFPNMFVSAHPDYLMLHRLLPIDRGNTQVHCHFLATSDSSSESLARAWQMWDTVNRQDWRVCELTQAGTNSPAYEPGPYSNLETMLIAFDRHYRSVINLRSDA